MKWAHLSLSTGASQQEDTGFESGLPPFCVEFECSPRACLSFLRGNWLLFCASLFIWHILTWFLLCLQCFTIEKLGRRPLMIGGFAVMGVCSVGITLAFSFQVCAHVHACIRVSAPIIRKLEMIKNWCLQQNRSLWVLFKAGLSKFHTLTELHWSYVSVLFIYKKASLL